VYEFDESSPTAQVKHLEVVAEVEQPGYGTALCSTSPCAPPPRRRRSPSAPLLGEHTAEILDEIGVRRPRSSASPPPARSRSRHPRNTADTALARSPGDCVVR